MIGERPASVLRERLDPQAGRHAGIDAGDCRSAGVGDDRHAVAPRQRLVREQLGDVELLVQGLDADDARVVEERVDRRLRGLQQSTGMRRRGAPPRGAAPALDDDHRLGRGQPPADLRKALGIPERLEIQEDDVGAVVLLPEAQEVVARQVSLVAHRDERREAEAPARGVVERGDPVGAALRSARDAARAADDPARTWRPSAPPGPC